MAHESLRVTKLASTTRLSDRYLTVQVKEAPDVEQMASFGRLCALVEIEGSWQSNSQVGQTIINTVARQYFRGTHSDPLANFEAALKKANETLKQSTQTGSTDWIGHLHAALVVVIGSEIHIATTGQVYGTLFREHKATPMTDQQAEQDAAPNKIFGTLLSGTVEPGDQLVIASSGLRKLFSQHDIEQLVADSGEELATQLNTLLQTKRGSWINAFVIDAPTTTPQERATTVTIDSSNVNWKAATAALIARTQRFLKPLNAWFVQTKTTAQTTATAQLIPTSKAKLEQTKAWSTKQFEHITTSVLPSLQQQSRGLWHKLRSSTQTRTSTPPSDVKTSSTEPVTAEPRTPATPKIENLIGRSVYAIRDYSSIAETPPTEAPTITEYNQSVTKKPHPVLGLPKLRLPNLTTLGQRVEWRSILFGLLALLLFIILATNIRVITNQRQTEQSKQGLLTQLNTLQDKLEEARLARIFNQPEKAAAALAEVLAGLPALTDSSVGEGARLLEEKAQGELDELTSTTRLTNLNELATIPNGRKVAQSGNLLISVDSDGTLTRIDADSGKTRAMAVPGGEQIMALVAYDNQAGIVTLTNRPATFSLTPGQEELSPIETNGEWKRGVGLASFFGNLYVLQADEHQIWKYALTQGSYGKAEPFVTDGTKFDNAIDIAIDGQIYILRSDGTVTRFNKGKADSFSLAAPPKPTESIAQPKQLFTTRESSRLYVLDGGRILAFDKSGAFQAQYAFKNIDTIQGFTLDEGKKVFTILTDTKLYAAQF